MDFFVLLCSEGDPGHGALPSLAIDTSPGRVRRNPDASEGARVLWPQSATEWQRLSIGCPARRGLRSSGSDASVYDP